MPNMTNRDHWITRIIVVVAFIASEVLRDLRVPEWIQNHREVLERIVDVCAQLTGGGA